MDKEDDHDNLKNGEQSPGHLVPTKVVTRPHENDLMPALSYKPLVS